MKKLLITYNYLLHYRKPLFNELSKVYDVTVLHSGNSTVESSDDYDEILVHVKRIGPLFLQSGVLTEVRSKKYDVIISLCDVRWINTVTSIYLCDEGVKFIWWGAWMTNNRLANKVRLYLTKKSYSNIFYTNESRNQFIEEGVDPGNLFVANNTFDVGERTRSYANPEKDTILFVGSLDGRKQNDILINAYRNICDRISDEITLTIVGDGDQKRKLEKLVMDLDLGRRVSFEGSVVDTKILLEYYERAIVSVSFGQAGLSVLQSLGFGVPFLTKKNAISGGEKSNIKDGVNSLFCDDDIKSLESKLLLLCTDTDYARRLGKNAYEYYSEFCTIKNMAQGFRDAIKSFALACFFYVIRNFVDYPPTFLVRMPIGFDIFLKGVAVVTNIILIKNDLSVS